MPPFRWQYYGERVLREIDARPADIQEDFYRLMYRLGSNPKTTEGVLPLKDQPGGYTAAFDAALLDFEVLADHPRIHLRYVLWELPNGS